MTTRFNYHPPILQAILQKISDALVHSGKVVIDITEFEELQVKSIIGYEQGNNISELPLENPKRTIKEIIFSIPFLSNYVSAVIINEASVSDLTLDSLSFIYLFRKNRIIPGIKLNKRIIKLHAPVSGWISEGLDDLAFRCKQYKNQGFHFAQWSSLLEVSSITPTIQNIEENAKVLARFVSICQAYQIVPIINVDIIHNGIHDINRSQKVTETVLAIVFKSLNDHHVFLKGLILKTNFVTQGIFCEKEFQIEEIAVATILALRRTVPVSVGGIMFTVNDQWKQNTVIYANNIIKYIKEKYDNLYSITFCTNKLDHYSLMQPVTDEEEDQSIQHIQKQILSDMYDLSNASLGVFNWHRLRDTA